MIEITASAETLVDQGAYTAEVYLGRAIDAIDKAFDQPGYAKAHPELVGAFMHAATADLRTSVWASVTQDAIEQVTAPLIASAA